MCESGPDLRRAIDPQARHRSMTVRAGAAAALILAAVACQRDPDVAATQAKPPTEVHGRADAGGYALSYVCRGEGSPAVILEAGLDAAGTRSWAGLVPVLDPIDTRVCAYDRAGTGSSARRPRGVDAPTAGLQAAELHAVLGEVDLVPPYVLVAHSYGGLIARMFADRYPSEVAGLVFEAVSTAWEIDLWPEWDTRPWIDGGRVTDIEATKHQVLEAAPLGSRPSVVVSQDTYDDEGIPEWAVPNFVRQQARLATLGTDVIHVRADGAGHFIHDERPAIIASAVAAVVDAVRTDRRLPACRDIFGPELGTCLS
jgi:pimeloyl-ACP methyl ester carboxylesterase